MAARFTGRYDGNTDVYVVAAGGGEPRRLTWHPGADVALGWSPDGKQVLFRSPRMAVQDAHQLYLVPAAGGAPTAVPLPSGEEGAFSPDAARMAYSPIEQWQPAWKQYRGGQTARIWVARLSDSAAVTRSRAPTATIAIRCGSGTGLFPVRPRRADHPLQL
jgi:tricorn protease